MQKRVEQILYEPYQLPHHLSHRVPPAPYTFIYIGQAWLNITGRSLKKFDFVHDFLLSLPDQIINVVRR